MVAKHSLVKDNPVKDNPVKEYLVKDTSLVVKHILAKVSSLAIDMAACAHLGDDDDDRGVRDGSFNKYLLIDYQISDKNNYNNIFKK